MTGKRPGYYNKRNISANAVRLCKKLVDEAWSDPAFLKEEKIACGDDKKWVFAHQRGDKRVKGHCRKLNAPRPRAKKAKPDPREKELVALIRKRDATSNLSDYSALDKRVKALRADLRPKPQPKSQPKPQPAPSRPSIASKPFGADTGDTFVLDRIVRHVNKVHTGGPRDRVRDRRPLLGQRNPVHFCGPRLRQPGPFQTSSRSLLFLFSSSARERVCASIYTPMWLIVVPPAARRSWLEPRLCLHNPRLH
eukprot:COSAG06_NODE_377_length_16646_cov_21.984589_2_plen_251_part_00